MKDKKKKDNQTDDLRSNQEESETIESKTNDGTISMLEKMKEKVDAQESLSDSYGDMADENS